MINSKPLRKLSEVVSNKVKRAEVYFTIGHITVYGSFSGEKQDLPKNHLQSSTFSIFHAFALVQTVESTSCTEH